MPSIVSPIQQDNRAYVMVFMNDLWSFIAINSTELNHDRGLMLIEEWKNDQHNLRLCRVAYSKSAASQWIQKITNKKLELMEGPDLYVVVNEKNDTMMTVWKPNTIGKFEISYGKDYKMVDQTINNEDLFVKMLDLLKPCYGELNIVSNKSQEFLLQWKF